MSESPPEHDSSSERRRFLHPEERRRKILQLLQERGSSSVAAIVEEFGVSPTTARRDLRELAAEGRARRTHGGALRSDLAAGRVSFDVRLETDAEDKIRLARAAAAAVRPGETLFIDSTSTAYYVLREILRSGLPVTVATNSLPAMVAVSDAGSANVDLIGLGGIYRTDNRSFVGAVTVQAIRNIVIDRLLLSVKGMEEGGLLTDPHPMEAEVKRAMIERARAVVLVTASRKFDARGLYLVGDFEDVDIAYLADPPREAVAALEHAGVDVRLT